MMRQVSLATAKNKLSEYAAAAAHGEEIVITRHGQPYARMVALDDVVQRRHERDRLLAGLDAYRARLAERGGGMSSDAVMDLIDAQRR